MNIFILRVIRNSVYIDNWLTKVSCLYQWNVTLLLMDRLIKLEEKIKNHLEVQNVVS